MDAIAILAYALAVGLTLSGIAGTVTELRTGRRLGFRPPFVLPSHLFASLALTMAAGPFMLANEAIAAHRAGLIGGLALILCGAAALAWSTASGVVAVELALAVSSLLA